jgi:polysaccharide export outer membrane protein
MLRVANIIIALSVILITVSCGDIKKLQYLQGQLDTVALSKIQYVEPVIQKGDILSITVYSDNSLASSLYNQSSTTPTPSNSGSGGVTGAVTSSLPTYLVNEQGDIQLFQIGLFKVEGLSKKQVADSLTSEYKKRNLLSNPYVEVRFVNFKVTLIGDVVKPGVYTFPSEKVSVFDAIGLAGDLTNFARRDNILIVRESNGIRQFGRIDLSKPDAFLSPYYYLQQNDMVVVDITRAKAVANDQATTRNIYIATSVISVLAIIVSIFR